MKTKLIHDQHTKVSRALIMTIPDGVVSYDCTGRPPEGIRVVPSLVAYDDRNNLLLIHEITDWSELAAFTAKAEALETTADAEWEAERAESADAQDLQNQITNQIAWLQDKVDNWASLSVADKDAVFKRQAQVNIAMLKAWRFVIRKLGQQGPYL